MVIELFLWKLFADAIQMRRRIYTATHLTCSGFNIADKLGNHLILI